MRVLIACEYSGRFRDAFLALGHDAVSCDLLDTEAPGPHFKGDIRKLLQIDRKWDLMIAHPECTRLTNAGVRWLRKAPPGKTLVQMWRGLFEGAEFYQYLRDVPIPLKAIENPVMHCHARELIRPGKRQVVQPWWFGDPFFKATGWELIGQALVQILPRVSESTRVQYRAAGAKLSKAFAEFGPRDVMPKHVAQFKAGMAATPNMANRCLSVLRQVFDYALEQQLVDSNPAIGIRRHAEKKRDRLPTPAEIEAIHQVAGPRLRVIVELLRRCGQRTVNTLRIRMADLREEGIQFPPQKKGLPVIVKWTPGLRAAVEAARALHPTKVASLYLLPSRRPGKPPDYRSVKEQFDAACKAANVVDLHLHDLRAMSATQAQEEGKSAQDLLAHTTPQNTRRYLRGRKPKLVEGPEF